MVWSSVSDIVADVITQPSAGDWWQVVLPGHGKARVKSEDVLEYTCQQSYNCSIAFMSILDPDAVTAELVDLISDRMKTLDLIYDVHKSLSATWLRDRLLACPVLEELKLELGNGTLIHALKLPMIVQASIERVARLKALKGIFYIQRLLPLIKQFFTVLCDNGHAFTQQLEHLRFRAVIDDLADLDFLEGAVQMLNTNRCLRRFHLQILGIKRVPGLQERVDRQLVPLWENRAGQWAAASIGIHQKVALVSAVEAHRASNSASALCRMDSLVLSNVPGFAGERLIPRFLHLLYSNFFGNVPR